MCIALHLQIASNTVQLLGLKKSRSFFKQKENKLFDTFAFVNLNVYCIFFVRAYTYVITYEFARKNLMVYS